MTRNFSDVTFLCPFYWIKALLVHSANCKAKGFRIGDGRGPGRNGRRLGETKSIGPAPPPSQCIGLVRTSPASDGYKLPRSDVVVCWNEAISVCSDHFRAMGYI